MNRKLSLLCLIVLMTSLIPLSPWAQEETVVEVPFTTKLPAILTNPGQAPEYSVLILLSKRVNIPIAIDFHLEADGLEDYQTLILIIGGSGKGLGSAGVSLPKEEERAKELISKAREKGIKIIGMHLGGEDRRGPNSDFMIELVTPQCDYVIIRRDGNQDGIFTRICEEKNIPLTEIEKSLELTDYLKALFISDK